MRLYSMSQAADILNVHRNTLLQWERDGKIAPASRNSKNNYRIYTYADLINIAQSMGLEYINKEK